MFFKNPYTHQICLFSLNTVKTVLLQTVLNKNNFTILICFYFDVIIPSMAKLNFQQQRL